jgi:hypothetical protein
LEGLPRMNWQSELTIANPDNYNRLFWNWNWPLITYKPLVDEAIELASHRPKKSNCFE